MWDNLIKNENDNTDNLGKDSFYLHLRDFINTNSGFENLLLENNMFGCSELEFKNFIKSNDEKSAIQKYLIEIIQKLSIWLEPDFYTELPIIFPYSVRGRFSSVERKNDKKDNWGAANNNGFVIDDNSMIKDYIRYKTVKNGIYYSGKKPRKGFTACHIWPETTANHKLFSFVPNLCWLPSPIAGLSDDQTSLFSQMLKIISYELYKNVELKSSKMHTIVEQNWRLLFDICNIDSKLKIEIDRNRISYSDQTIKRKEKVIANIRKILDYINLHSTKNIDQQNFEKKLLHTRYKKSLFELINKDPNSISHFKRWITKYLTALTDST